MSKRSSLFFFIIPALSLFFSILFLFSCARALSEEERREKSLELFKELGRTLQSELADAIQKGGPENAIQVCANISPLIEEKISKEQGLKVRRISDKYRNPNHAPTDWEKEVLNRWKEDISKGIAPAIYTTTENNEYRVMKPILLDNPTCLKCHGMPVTEINKPTLDKLQEIYPNDNAKGYKLGELRGAFSATWKL